MTLKVYVLLLTKLVGKAGLKTPDLTKSCYVNLAVPVPFDNLWTFSFTILAKKIVVTLTRNLD